MKPREFSFRPAVSGAICLLAVVLLAACDEPNSPPEQSPTPATAVPADRLAWNLQTSVETYEKAGFAGAAWDEAARNALRTFARGRALAVASDEAWPQTVSSNCAWAVKAGCKDPMVAYLHARFVLHQTETNAVTLAEAYRQAAESLHHSSYPSVRKFYGALRAAEQLKVVAGTNTPPEVHQFRHSAMHHLAAALEDKSMPIIEVDEACRDMFKPLSSNKTQHWNCYELIEKPLFANWPEESVAWFIKGDAYIDWAWQARGSGYANKVTEEGWKLFSERLAVAEQSLERAWELNPKDPRIAREMMRVELGQGEGRERMELWFGRAMALNTNYYDACKGKLFYLEPKWHGSKEDMLAFGWQCAESKEWGGSVPLILLDAHIAIRRYLEGEEQDNYWKQPDVWPDIKMAFERFFEVNPDAQSWYHNYAWYAHACEAWDKLNELLPKLGPVNYSYFGGETSFNQMVALAQQHAGETKPEIINASTELKRLLIKIAAKWNAGKRTEEDFAAELTLIEALLAKYKDEKTDDVAQIIMAKAQLYLRAFDNPEKARELVSQIKEQFTETELGRNADDILAFIEQREKIKMIQSSLVVGAKFPDFQEQDLSGKPLSIANYEGKVVLLDFWATWCGPCLAELPNLLKTYEKYHRRDFEVVGISLDQDKDKLLNFTTQKGIAWPQYFDGKGWENKLARQYGINSIPATFLLDRHGKILAKDLRGDALDELVGKALSAE